MTNIDHKKELNREDKIKEIRDKIPLYIKDKEYILSDNWYNSDIANDSDLYIGYSNDDDEYIIKFESGDALDDTQKLYNYLIDNNLIN